MLESEPLAGTVLITKLDIDGLVQFCSNSIANALELLQSCTEPSIWLVLSFHGKGFRILSWPNNDVKSEPRDIQWSLSNQYIMYIINYN